MTQLPAIATATIMLLNISCSDQQSPLLSFHWKQAAELPIMKEGHRSIGFAGPVAGLHHDKLIFAGGANFPKGMPWLGGEKKYYDDIYVFDKNNNNDIVHYGSFKLPSAIAYAAVCTTPFGVLYAGGENEHGISDKVYLLQWDITTDAAVTMELPSLPTAVTNAAATLSGNTIYIAGGEMPSGPSSQFLSLDLDEPAAGWKQLPAIPRAVSHTVLNSIDHNGRRLIFLAGGRSRQADGISELYRSLYEFDLRKNQWTEKKSLPYPLSAGTGLAIDSDHLVLFGGDKGEVFHQVEELIVAIGKEKDETKKMQLNNQKMNVQSNHPGFSREVLMYSVKSDEWSKIDSILFDSPVTTTAIKWDDVIIIPSGEIRAGVRSPFILSAKISTPGK
ncbi:hypothetical protein ACFSQD_08055 [Flavihumibacter stibioxidans]|nr:hypothetical protein [Flavihumibacter stibioxidans]